MQLLVQEFRHALRQLLKSPGFTAISVLTLAIGIGANIAVFSVTNAVLLNPSGIPHADNLVALRARYSAMPDLANIGISPPDFGDAADGKNMFSSSAVMQGTAFNFSRENANPELLKGAKVSSGYFDVFQVRPYLGRVFTAEEDQPKAGLEAVLSYGTWRKRFGSDPNIVGRTLMLNEQPYRVVGVMGSDFDWPNAAELWVPIGLPPGIYHDHNNRYNEYLFGAARLSPGVTLQQANAYLNMKAQQNISSEESGGPGGGPVPKSFARASGWGMFAMPLTEFIGGSLRKPLTMLLIAVGMVLLIACANIAGLQMARASAKQRDLAIHVALGASRKRLIRKALVESAVLTVAGLVLGFAVTLSVVPLLMHYLPALLGTQIQPSLRGPVFLYVIAIAVLSSLLCGIVPAWQRTQPGWFNALQESGRSGTSGKASQFARSSMVVGQIALSLLLLAGAGLLLTSLKELERVETGFDPGNVLSATISLPKTVYGKDAEQAAFYAALDDRLRTIPGVSKAAVADSVPFDNNGGSASFRIQGRPNAPNDPGPHGNVRSVSPEYFETLRIPLLQGRGFTAEDREKSQLVAVIDEPLARRYWPGQNPVGQHITLGDEKGPWLEIVGIVAHAKASSLESDTNEGFYYLPMAQSPVPSGSIVVRSSRSAEDLANDVAAAVRGVDASIPIYDVKTMEERVNESLVGRKFVVLLLTTFAGLALLLAALGLYGVISYSVRLRTRELGVRMALGAQRSEVLQLVLLQGARLAALGVAIGVVCALVLGRVFSSLLFRVSVLNGWPWFSATALLVITVLVASYLPARRAASIEPVRALRNE